MPKATVPEPPGRRHIGRLPVVEDDVRLTGIVTWSDLLTVFLHSDEDLLVAVLEAIAAVDNSPSCTIWASVNDGVVLVQGWAQLLSQVMAVGALVRRVPGIVRRGGVRQGRRARRAHQG